MLKKISSEVSINDTTGEVFLKLDDKRKQRIACLKENKLEVMKDVKNIIVKYQTIGFNFDLIKKGEFTDVEVRLSDGRVLTTTRERILEKGKVFKNPTYELQIFFPIKDFIQNN